MWAFIGSAYFIVITQMSEKRDIFTHHPRGDESGFPEKEARKVTEKGEEEEIRVMSEKKMAAKCVVVFFSEKRKPKKTTWGGERDTETDIVEGLNMKKDGYWPEEDKRWEDETEEEKEEEERRRKSWGRNGP